MHVQACRVAYLVRARRTLVEGDFPREVAIKLLASYKRRGLTAWLEDTAGNFVPVKGTMRRPAFLPRAR